MSAEKKQAPSVSRFYQAMKASGEEYGKNSPSPDVGDNDLIQGALDGDLDSFAGLMQRYERRAFWCAFHVLGEVEEARDVVQDAFLRVHRSLERFDFDRNFYTWLYRIVTNLSIDRLRKRKNEVTLTIDDERAAVVPDPTVLGSTPEEQMVCRERSWKVRKVLDSLPAAFRTVMALRDLHGLSCREIGPILDLTYATVRWRLHKARRLFRDAWERAEMEGGESQ
ncbi:MAG TPA: sigma-70 family RNA polymerase sigma factor [Planctomycetes bacterium]|nr:sigma-70 family RNA polymerase sigma factor [Planctomycetota bacterium]